MHRLGGGTSFTPRPKRRSLIRRFEFDLLSYDVVWDLDWRLNNASLEVKPLGVQLQSGDQIELNVQRQFDAPNEDSTLFPGATVCARGSWWNRVEAQYSGAERRTVRLNLTGSTGQFYDGRSSEVSAGLRARRTPHILATLDLVRSVVSLAQSSFTANTVRLRSDYACSPRLNSTQLAHGTRPPDPVVAPVSWWGRGEVRVLLPELRVGRPDGVQASPDGIERSVSRSLVSSS
ncbi:hypothetical protein [Gemmatimonas sp.]|uniref:hypothetical protein n=1 Tax=Gemmatimonas sp. TaxID=1962908 RepID=UPI003562F4E2